MLMSDKMKTKYVFTFCNSFLKLDSNCDYTNYVNFNERSLKIQHN